MKLPSGKFVIRLDPSLHARLRTICQTTQVSLNHLCVEQIKTLVASDANSIASVQRFGISVAELQKLLGRNGFKISSCLVFGSAVRGESTTRSDIDLLFVLSPGEHLSRDLYTQWDKKIAPFFVKRVVREVSPQFVNLPTEVDGAGSLWLEAAIEGVILWDNENSLSNFLIVLRSWIASGQARRKLSHGHPYWITLTELQ